MLTRSRKRSLHSIAALPQDLQLNVCELLTDPHDRASICLADPRLGLAALQQLPSFQCPLTSVALAIQSRGAKAVIDEALLRRYTADRRATAEGAAWLKAAAERYGWPTHLKVFVNDLRENADPTPLPRLLGICAFRLKKKGRSSRTSYGCATSFWTA